MKLGLTLMSNPITKNGVLPAFLIKIKIYSPSDLMECSLKTISYPLFLFHIPFFSLTSILISPRNSEPTPTESPLSENIVEVLSQSIDSYPLTQIVGYTGYQKTFRDDPRLQFQAMEQVALKTFSCLEII
jgi:hypothetical protein